MRRRRRRSSGRPHHRRAANYDDPMECQKENGANANTKRPEKYPSQTKVGANEGNVTSCALTNESLMGLSARGTYVLMLQNLLSGANNTNTRKLNSLFPPLSLLQPILSLLRSFPFFLHQVSRSSLTLPGPSSFPSPSFISNREIGRRK